MRRFSLNCSRLLLAFLFGSTYSRGIRALQFPSLLSSSIHQHRFQWRLAQQGMSEETDKQILPSKTRSLLDKREQHSKNRLHEASKNDASNEKKRKKGKYLDRPKIEEKDKKLKASTFNMNNQFSKKMSEMVRRSNSGMNLTRKSR